MTDKLTVFVCRRGRNPKLKKWIASVHDVSGFLLDMLKIEAATYDEAFECALGLAQPIKGSFMVKMGLGERLVDRSPTPHGLTEKKE